MNRWGARLINGFLIFFSSSVIFIGSENILRTGAVNLESKVIGFFLLFNPIILLVTSTFGIFVSFFYLLILFFATQRLIYLYEAKYLFNLLPIFILTWFISIFIRIKLYSKIRKYKNRLRASKEKTRIVYNGYEEDKKIESALRKKFERFSKLKFITEQLSNTLVLEEITHLAVDKISQIIPKVDIALIYLLDENSELSLSSWEPKDWDLVEVKGDIFDSWVLRYGAGLIVQDVRRDFRFPSEELEKIRMDVRSLIACPLKTENRMFGLLRLDSNRPDNFSPDDLRILDVFSNLVAMAIQNALLYRQTEELAKKDGLTNLYLPRYFHSSLEEMLRKDLESAQFTSLLMLDIDYFKEYNDRFGHLAGDIVLKRVANILVSFLREKDFAVRYGGEEFLLVLVETGKKEAIERAESIRQKVVSEVFYLRRQETRVTVSIGIATYPLDGKTKDELLHKADEWLYYAKEKGKNRIAYTGIR